MKQTKETFDQEMSHPLMVRERREDYLPSNEFRELVPQLKDEIDLRDILDTIVRRKGVVLACLLFCFFAVALYTFTVTPQFRAKGVLRVSAQSDKIVSFENIDSQVPKSREFQQTQVKLLQSEQLASRVIDRMDLINNPDFNSDIEPRSNEAKVKTQAQGWFGRLKVLALGLFDTIKAFVRPEGNKNSLELLDEDARTRVVVDQVLEEFEQRFTVDPIRDSELVNISFAAVSPTTAAEVANAAMEEFINMHMDSKLKSSQATGKFLQKQIEAAQIKLEKSEMELQKYARKIGIVSLDPKSNLVMRQLEELNDALAKARSHRISEEARYQQVIDADSSNLNQMMENELIQNLKNQYATLLAEFRELSKTFKPEYPKMQQLKAKMDQINERIAAEQSAIIESIKNDYETAVKAEEYLAARTEEQKERTMNLEEKATQYKILEREVSTNKAIYQSLLERSKEIEAIVGAAVTNIQIVDYARPPLYPFKPRVVLNLIIGLAAGLLSGISMAFLFEYFDNTIKDPSEMTERFGIPVLGLIPYDKDGFEDRKHMALKFYTEPRSPVAEAFRTTMTSVRLSVADEPPKSILITSILPSAGKSSMASNTCLSYLAEDEKCLLIDTDLRKPSLHHVFNEGMKGKGLSSILSGMAKLSEVVVKTEYPGLDFIGSGPLPPNPAELLSSKRMRQLVHVATRHYDRVVLDGPPFQGFAEILVLANIVDGVILISVEGETPREGVKHFRRSVGNVGGRILGTIINKAGRKKGYASYSGYKYYSYNYDYGKR